MLPPCAFLLLWFKSLTISVCDISPQSLHEREGACHETQDWGGRKAGGGNRAVRTSGGSAAGPALSHAPAADRLRATGNHRQRLHRRLAAGTRGLARFREARHRRAEERNRFR